MSADRFHRLMALTDAVHRRLPAEAPAMTYAADEALQAEAQAMFEAQGLAVSPDVIQAAARDLDHAPHQPVTAPIVPLPVAARPLKVYWWQRQRHQHARQGVMGPAWRDAFDQVRQERLRQHTGVGVIASPLSDAQVTHLGTLLDQGADANGLVPWDVTFKEKKTSLFPAGMPAPLTCVWMSLNHYTDPDALAYVDAGLLAFLTRRHPDLLHVRRPKSWWHFKEEIFKGLRGGVSLAQMMAYCLKSEMLHAMQVNWDASPRWHRSVLWHVLLQPLSTPEWQATRIKKWSEATWRQNLEATVRYVLAHEADSAEHHARVIREAVLRGHPHADWLKLWLPEHASAQPGLLPT